MCSKLGRLRAVRQDGSSTSMGMLRGVAFVSYRAITPPCDQVDGVNRVPINTVEIILPLSHGKGLRHLYRGHESRGGHDSGWYSR